MKSPTAPLHTVTVRGVSQMTRYERRELARWLRSAAKTVEREGGKFGQRVRFRLYAPR